MPVLPAEARDQSFFGVILANDASKEGIQDGSREMEGNKKGPASFLNEVTQITFQRALSNYARKDSFFRQHCINPGFLVQIDFHSCICQANLSCPQGDTLSRRGLPSSRKKNLLKSVNLLEAIIQEELIKVGPLQKEQIFGRDVQREDGVKKQVKTVPLPEPSEGPNLISP